MSMIKYFNGGDNIMKILWKDKFKEKDKIVYWIREWFDSNKWNLYPVKGEETIPCKAIVPISGNKDSAVVAALCAEALGKNRVIGVILSDNKMKQEDLDDARKVVELLEIGKLEFNISTIEDYVDGAFISGALLPSGRSSKTTEECTRMAVLYSLAKKINNSYVACTLSASDLYVGNVIKYGNLAGDFAPLAAIPETLILDIGRAVSYTIPEFMSILENDRHDNVYVDYTGHFQDISYNFLDGFLFDSDSEDSLYKVIDDMHITASKSTPYPNIPMYNCILNAGIENSEDEETVYIVETE
jgi:NAD+ synthase